MLYLLALHIIFVVTWFAGLFYIVRLFVYHAEVQMKQEPDRRILSDHFKLASRRLWYGITWPSAILTWIFGFSLLETLYSEKIPDWLWLKLFFVILLSIYHFSCHRIFSNFQKDKFSMSGMQLRLWNEVATIFLVAIVFIVVMKDLTNWLYGLAGMVAFSLILLAGIKMYRNYRKRDEG